MAGDRLRGIAPLDEGSGHVSVVVETLRGSRQKYSYDPETGLFRWKFELPEGTVFPFSFGFVPNTLAEDGDPLDILLLLDGDVPTGILVEARPVAVIEAEQTKDGRTLRNDRVIAVASLSRTFAGVRDIGDLRPGLLEELERFFAHFNALRGQTSSAIGRKGAAAALDRVREAIAAEARRGTTAG